MTLTFDNPSGMLWLVAAVAVCVLSIGAALWRRRASARLADAALLQRIAPGFSLSRGIWRAVLLGGAASALAVALMDPRANEQTEELTRRGADVMFVVDVSRSMLAEDATPNRLERARTFISDAIDAMGGDRAGLIDFAGVAALRAPLTLNYDALKSAVDGLEPKDSRRGGSMLGNAIRLAVESFPTDDAGHAIVILSDGEDMGSDPVDAAKEAAEKGIRIITVGIGDPREGARIPVGEGPNQRFLVYEGEEVWSRMDSATLRDVANATGGLFVPAGTAQVELGEILTRSLSDLERTEGDSSVAKTTAPLFQWPAALALALLVIESMISARARRAKSAIRSPVTTAPPSGTPTARPVPGRPRRPRQLRTALGATAAAAAMLIGVTMEARADDPTRAIQGMRDLTAERPTAQRNPAATGVPPVATTSATQDVPAASPGTKKSRTVGRGQIDRAAFRDSIRRASASMQSGEYADAAAAYAEAMDADPTHAAAAFNRGVAEYRAGKLDEAAVSFAQAASLGDAALAADAMFNQGNATYQSALRALAGGAPDADPAGASGATLPTPPAAAQPDLTAATEAVSQALTHYKDAIAADPSDVDSRANAELAHTLLKQLREIQQQQQQNEQDQKEQQKTDKEEPQDKKDSQQNQRNDGQRENPQQGDGQQDSDQKKQDQQGEGDKASQSNPSEGKEPEHPASETEPSQGDDQEKSKDGERDRQTGNETSDEKDSPNTEQRGQSEDKAGDNDKKNDKAQREGEVKPRNGAEQSPSDRQPPVPAQARAGEPLPGAPLTKSEADRLLQGVRDRAKQRTEAKERAERVRQIPAVRDW